MKRLLLTTIILLLGGLFMANQDSEAETATINLTAEVMGSLAIMADPSTLSFGTLIAGNVSYATGGVDIIVATNAANGYQLAISDNEPGANSSMTNQGDLTTKIADYAASIGSPEPYDIGDKGLGFTLYAADTNKEAEWGTGATFNSSSNNYAGIPQDATVFHLSPGYKDVNDHSYIGFLLDVPGYQKSGSYSGDIVITGTTVLE